jgi:lipoprotein NlpD
MKYTPRFALLLTLGMLAACSTPSRHAPVIERPTTNTAPSRPRPATPPAEENKPDARGTYTVHKGDTLLRIALDHGQSYRDLVTWNNLADPDDIKVGQVLKVAPPERVATVPAAPVAAPTPDTRAQVPKKSAPKGEKRPYPDTSVADASKAEGAKAEGAKAENAKAEPAPAAPAGIAPGATVTATDDERLSWMWPSDGKIVATFDEGKNKGIDIAGKLGQQVMAAGDGKVMFAGSGIRGYGNLVIVKHSNSLLSAYAHNRTIMVKEGQTVSKGQVIAEMGDSDADSVKLHFEIRQQGKPVDPSRYLPSR